MTVSLDFDDEKVRDGRKGNFKILKLITFYKWSAPFYGRNIADTAYNSIQSINNSGKSCVVDRIS